jgi:hypothetical protein
VATIKNTVEEEVAVRYRKEKQALGRESRPRADNL